MTQFATNDDLATRLGIEFTDPQKTRADALLSDASGLIQDAASGQKLELVTDDALVIPGTSDDRIRLPQRPVVSVASVTLDSSALAEGIVWWRDGDTIIRFGSHVHHGLSRGFGRPWQTLRIVYTHGYSGDDMPQLFKSICVEAVARVFNNPAGVISERVGDTEVTFASYSEPAAGLLLTANERRQIRRFVGGSAGSIQLG